MHIEEAIINLHKQAQTVGIKLKEIYVSYGQFEALALGLGEKLTTQDTEEGLTIQYWSLDENLNIDILVFPVIYPTSKSKR